MFEYMTAQEVAEKWNVSLRWVQRLCKENRIEGVLNINRVSRSTPPRRNSPLTPKYRSSAAMALELGSLRPFS
ncbi:helix-turn-helix domain-containing protein [Oscillospiraceae bacterium 21-37]